MKVHSYILPLALMLALSAGCSTPTPRQSNLSSSVPLNDVTRPMLGQWEAKGNNILAIEEQDDRAVICYRENDTWLINVRNARVVSNVVRFVTEHYIRDGSSHPVDGVPCECVVEPINTNQLKYGVISEHMPEYDFWILNRVK